MDKTREQRPNYSALYSSSYRDSAVGEKWKHSNINFWVKSEEKKNKEQNKSDGGAHWRTEA